MSKNLIALSLVLVFSFVMIIEQAYTNSSRPPSTRTNAPGEGSCADAGCHDTGSLNSGSGNVSISIEGNPLKYKPDSSYNLTVAVNDASMSRFGFEITTLDANDEFAGSYSVSGSTALLSGNVNGNTRKYVSHSNAGATKSWTFKWKAPAAGTGPVTFYVAGNAANSSSSDAGDLIYTSTLALEQDSVPTNTGINYTRKNSSLLNVYPNPAIDHIIVNTTTAGALKIFNINGQLKAEYKCSSKGANEIKLNREELSSGVYILSFSADKENKSSKIYLQ